MDSITLFLTLNNLHLKWRERESFILWYLYMGFYQKTITNVIITITNSFSR